MGQSEDHIYIVWFWTKDDKVRYREFYYLSDALAFREKCKNEYGDLTAKIIKGYFLIS
jgi:hypothetical protein